MAHFAQLDGNNVVTQVLVVNNSEILDGNNVEQESLGVTFLQNLIGADTVWKQTSFNGNIRKNYAGIGFTYDVTRDAFIPPQPFASWTLNDQTCRWDCPVPYPTDGQFYNWNESTLSWDLITE